MNNKGILYKKRYSAFCDFEWNDKEMAFVGAFYGERPLFLEIKNSVIEKTSCVS